MRENLLPPDGTGWRGQIGSENKAKNYQGKYNAYLHILRILIKDGITKKVRDFVESGGILLINFAPEDWKGAS